MIGHFKYGVVADMAIKQLRSFIDTEKQLITHEHELMDKLLSWDYIILHLDERCAEGSRLHILNTEIVEQLIDIRVVVGTEKISDLQFKKEERLLLEHLETDLEHRDWRAVKMDINLELDVERETVRLHDKELNILHQKFEKLMHFIRKHINPSQEQIIEMNKKRDFERLEDYYLLQIYKFVHAYERIFKHLFVKESLILKRLKR